MIFELLQPRRFSYSDLAEKLFEDRGRCAEARQRSLLHADTTMFESYDGGGGGGA